MNHLVHLLRALFLRPPALDRDERYLAAAVDIHDLEIRQHALERTGV